jgi:Clp amino terminal domain, pathogenicity island component
MAEPFAGALSPTAHYYQIKGRADEIARALNSPADDAEHLFLGMLHDGGWPVTVISGLVDLGRAEAAVLSIINSPGYSPPPAPRFPRHEGWVRLWGADVASAMGDSYVGVEHAFVAMIRRRDSVPARALAGLADLDALEAAVLQAKNAPPGGPPADAVFLPEGQEMDRALRIAIVGALPEGTTFGLNGGTDGRTWVHVFGPVPTGSPELTREVLNTALASLNRPTLDS